MAFSRQAAFGKYELCAQRPPFLPAVKSLDELSLQIWQITQIFLPLDSSSINPREFLWASFEKGRLGEFSNEIEWNFCLFPAPPLGQLCQ